MPKIVFNSSCTPYFSKDFIKGFEVGVARQYETDQKTGQENINAVLEDIVEWATHNNYGFISVDCSIRHGVYLDELIEFIKCKYVEREWM